MKKELGVLCHVTSLPSKYGIGDFGKPCFKFIDFLSKQHVNIWQVLPLNHTNEFNSPYGALDYFAFDEMFVDLDFLAELKLVKRSEFKTLKTLNKTKKVNYALIKAEKLRILNIAFENLTQACIDEIGSFAEEKPQILNYAYYKALQEVYNTTDWRKTPSELWNINSKSATQFEKKHAKIINKHIFFQLLLFEQWQKIKIYANSKNIKIFGDMPIYLEPTSMDVFFNTQAFKLNKDLTNSITAGVPADEFNSNGQDWGTCVYNWDYLEKNNFEYMVEKIKASLNNYDILRLDHFAGYVEHFEIENHNIKSGKWVKGGGENFFNTLKQNVDLNKIIVEDLGALSEECTKVKQIFNLKGMNILQFAFDGNENNPHLPSNVKEGSTYYLGTHDNNTFIGYLNSLTKQEKQKIFSEEKSNKQLLIKSVKDMLNSKCEKVILQIQDFLMQDESFRMNYPGKAENCWEYRVPANYKKTFKKTLKKITQ